jgi:hypothetical protein
VAAAVMALGGLIALVPARRTAPQEQLDAVVAGTVAARG